jgi:hypothetical protein
MAKKLTEFDDKNKAITTAQKRKTVRGRALSQSKIKIMKKQRSKKVVLDRLTAIAVKMREIRKKAAQPQATGTTN